MTDRDRILAHLEQHGSVTSYEIRVNALSGNPAQRITELRDLGYTIDSERFTRNGRPATRYHFRGAPRLDHAAPGPAPSAGGSTPSHPSPPSASVPTLAATDTEASRAGDGGGAGGPAKYEAPSLQLFDSPAETPGHLDPDMRTA